MGTRLKPNGVPGYDLIWGWLTKIITGVVITLLTAATLGLYNLSTEVHSLTSAVAQMHLDIVEAKAAATISATAALANERALAQHLLEVEKLKALYVTKKEWVEAVTKPVVVVVPTKVKLGG